VVYGVFCYFVASFVDLVFCCGWGVFGLPFLVVVNFLEQSLDLLLFVFNLIRLLRF